MRTGGTLQKPHRWAEASTTKSFFSQITTTTERRTCVLRYESRAQIRIRTGVFGRANREEGKWLHSAVPKPEVAVAKRAQIRRPDPVISVPASKLQVLPPASSRLPYLEPGIRGTQVKQRENPDRSGKIRSEEGRAGDLRADLSYRSETADQICRAAESADQVEEHLFLLPPIATL